jgi:hypothetical protein
LTVDVYNPLSIFTAIAGEIGYSFVTGLQGSKKSGTGASAKYRVASMVKHFVAFGRYVYHGEEKHLSSVESK